MVNGLRRLELCLASESALLQTARLLPSRRLASTTSFGATGNKLDCAPPKIRLSCGPESLRQDRRAASQLAKSPNDREISLLLCHGRFTLSPREQIGGVFAFNLCTQVLPFICGTYAR